MVSDPRSAGPSNHSVLSTSCWLADQPAPGLRYVAGSTRLDGASVSDPATAGGGRDLTFAIGEIPAGERLQLRYVLEVTPAVARGPAHNLALASSAAGTVSNQARASIEITDDLFRSESLLLGRVIVGSCDTPVENDLEGLAGVRVYLEDGRYGLTDEGGRFHFEGLDIAPANGAVISVPY